MVEPEYDVAIVGYGPTGQALASLLSRLGHTVVVLEKHHALYGLPRLCTVDGESARIVQAAGDVDRAFRASSWCRRMEFRDADGDLIVAVPFGEERVCGFPGRISFYQPDVEDVMDEAARLRGAVVQQGWEAVSVRQTEASVTVVARPRGGADSAAREFSARYLVGADGAKSLVRRAAGVDWEDFGYSDAFLSVDCERVGELPSQLDGRTGIGLCDPARHVGFVPIGSNRMRFEFGVEQGDDPEELLRETTGYEMLLATPWRLTKDQVRIYRQVIYPFEGKLARAWRSGRAFLAGDAAHLMPPFMGQGACSGLRDAANLAWKLHLVLGGVSAPTLLDSYERERAPHVRVHVRGSVDLGRVACERDPVAAEARNDAYRRGEMLSPAHNPTLADGILHRLPGGELAPYAGHLMVQGIVRKGESVGRFDDVVGWGFHVIGYGFDPLDNLNADQSAFLRRIGAFVTMISNNPDAAGVLDLERAYEPFFQDRDMMKCVIMRPDFYIFGAGWKAGDVGGLVDDLQEQLVSVADSALPDGPETSLTPA